MYQAIKHEIEATYVAGRDQVRCDFELYDEATGRAIESRGGYWSHEDRAWFAPWGARRVLFAHLRARFNARIRLPFKERVSAWWYRWGIPLGILAAIVFILAGLAGCAGAYPNDARMLRQQGASASFVTGFEHGCPSGQQAEGYIYAAYLRDFARYDSDTDYRSGWEHGYDLCARRMRALKRY